MLDCGSPQVGRHLRKAKIKIKACRILFCSMHQMLCGIKPPFCIRDLCQFLPHLLIYFCQVTDRRPVDFQCLADRNILFSYFYAITGYCLHLFSSNKSFLLSGFFLFFFLLSFDVGKHLVSAPVTDRYGTVRRIPQMPTPQFLF